MSTLKVLLLGFLVSCIGAPTGGDQVANCPEDYTFNSVQRKCTFTGGASPEGTLGLVHTNEDEDFLLTLNYNKIDGKQAARCVVRSEDQDVEYVSPNIVGVAQRGDTLADEARSAYLSIPSTGTFAATRATAQAASINADAAQLQLETASSTIVIVAALESLLANARIVANSAESVVENSQTFVKGRITNEKADELEIIKKSIADRCDCSNGVCKTLAKPRANFFGDSEFRYQIVDQLNRQSPVKEVINRVKSINDLPIASSMTVKEEESSTGTPAPILFTIPLAKDVEDNFTASQFHYELVNNPTNGYLTHCMGLQYSTSYSDRTCQYLPFDGDMNAEGVKASFTFNGINFVSAAPGVWGNDIKIEFIHQAGIGSNPVITVDGRAISILIEQGITTSLNVFASLINDPFAATILDFETSTDLLATNLTTGSFLVIQRTEYLKSGFNPHDLIEYRVFDGTSYSKHNAFVGIKIQAESDPPQIMVNRMTSPAITISEDTVLNTNLAYISATEDASVDDNINGVMIVWEDPEGDHVNGCEVTVDNNFHVLRDCECSAIDPSDPTRKPICSFLVKPYLDIVGTFTSSITMKVTSVDGLTAEAFLPVTIIEDHDAPLPAMINTEGFLESTTADALTYSFSIPAAFEQDATNPVSYSINSNTQNGVLANCLGLNGTSNTDLTCDYTPNNGNVTLVGSKGSLKVQSLRFTAKFSGSHSENISIEIQDEPDFSPGRVEVTNNGLNFVIKLRENTVRSDDLKTILEDPKRNLLLSKMVDITFAGPAAAFVVSDNAVPLVGGREGADSFTYSVTDGAVAGLGEGYVNIDIYPENDQATICQYSKFNDAPECGINGCLGEESPIVAGITPGTIGLKYYHQGTSVCYVSDGTTSALNWTVVNNSTQLISDQAVNEKDILVIDEIRIDEGGGSATSDICTANMPPVCILSGDTENVKRECSMAGDPDNSDLDVRIDAADVTANDQILFFNTLTTTCFKYNKTTSNWDLGGELLNISVDEDKQTVVLKNLTSSNSNLIPIENITILWKHPTNPMQYRIGDGVSSAPTDISPWKFGRTGISDDLYPFQIFIQPQLGQIQNATSATSTISFEIADEYIPAGGGASQFGDPISIEFEVTVNAVAAIHNGWNKILSYGPKTNKHNTVLDSEIVCTYHRDMCDGGQECKGTGDPQTLGRVPDDTFAIYHDTTNNKCYYSSSPGSANNWVEFSSSCAISHSRDRSECGGTAVSCINDGDPITNLVSSTGVNTFYYDRQNDVCYRSKEANSTSSWEMYHAPGEITIGWESFSIVGQASITGFDIFRRLAGEEFDYDRPINKEMLTVSTNEYVDNQVNSYYPPIPGTTYYYEVRPYVNSILTGTNENFNVVRVLTPPNNMALVHRWMANLAMCTILNKKGLTVANGGIDSRENYRCAYEGPGNTFISDKGYYDFGKDLLVDRFEAGCNYSASPVCTGTYDNSCIGDEDPTIGGVSAANDSVYYNRANGKCYYRKSSTWNEVNNSCDFDTNCGGGGASNCTGGSSPDGSITSGLEGSFYYDSTNDKCYRSVQTGGNSWDEVPGASSTVNLNLLMAGANTAQNPPLVYVNQKEAAAMCNASTALAPIVGVVENSLRKQLPSRKEHLIFSQWNTESLTANTIATMETGLSINSSSKCNSSSASGLESFFSDSPKPSSSVFYTLPGTSSSEIRSIMTGSKGKDLNTFGTELCQSQFGIQDSIGNVSEWVIERMTCVSGTECTGIKVGDSLAIVDESAGFTWKEILNESCPSISTNCDTDTPFNAFSSNCTGAVEPEDVFTQSSGSVYLNTANNKCYRSVSSFRGTNNDLTVEADSGIAASLYQYQVFKLGGPHLTSSSNAKFYPGPCKDTNADDICDDYLDGWRFEEEKFDAGHMFVPMGLPVHRDFGFFASSDLVVDSIAEIGPTSGITSANLHDDALYLNTHELFADFASCGSMAVGGSYLDGGDAGSYFFEFLPCSDSSLNTDKAFAIIGDLSYRSKSGSGSISVAYNSPSTFCSPIENQCDFGTGAQACQGAGDPTTLTATPLATGKFYLDTNSGECYVSNGTTDEDDWEDEKTPISISIAPNLVTVNFGMDNVGTVLSTATALKTAIDTEIAADTTNNDYFEVIVSGSGSNPQSSFVGNVVLDNDLSENKRVDLGFRCVVPVTDYADDVSDQ